MSLKKTKPIEWMRVKIEDDRIVFGRYPLRPASVFRRGVVVRDKVEVILPRRFVPQVRLRSGEVLFVEGNTPEQSAALRKELESFAERCSIPTRSDPVDVWSWIADEFLDTDPDFLWRETALDRLAERGLDRKTVREIRKRISWRMLLLTFVSWEWMHYDQFDVLCAMRMWSIPRRFAEFYRFSMEVARHDLLPPDTSVPGLVVEPARSRLEAHWKALEKPAGFGGEKSSALFERLFKAWGGHGRRYHTFVHLLEVLDFLSTHAPGGEPPLPVLLAAWFHDAVYEPMANDNEEKSAELAATELRALETTPPVIEEVKSLILMTRDHALARTANEKLLSDADLSILSASPERYRGYAGQVRLEYRHIGRFRYALGRRRFLRGVLRRQRREGRLYFHLSPAEEETARRNISAELRRLRFRGALLDRH